MRRKRSSSCCSHCEILVLVRRDSPVEVWIHTSTGESLRTKTKISQWEQQLDDRFLRIHRSYIVNADRVARHTAGAVVVDGRTLEVSRKYRDSVRAAIPESAPSARVRHISNDKPS